MARWKTPAGSLRSMIAGALTRSTPPGSVRGQIAELGGTRAAAQALGRSERTIRRWAQADRAPQRGGGQQALDQAVETYRGTSQARRGRLNTRREARMRNHGAKVTFRGVAGPTNDSPGTSIKRRNITWTLSPEGTAAIIDAYLANGEDAAIAELEATLAAEYMYGQGFGWTFQRVDALEFNRHDG